MARATTFNLFDHGFGLLGPHYGLRLDSTGQVFSVEDEFDNSRVSLDWVPFGASATISGVLRLVDPATDITLPPGDFSVSYVLSGITSIMSGGVLLGFEATAGTGMIETTVLTGRPDASGVVFRFLADGHRLVGDDSTAVGRGWLEPDDSIDDWLFQSPDPVVIPEPATALLLGLGLVALAGRMNPLRKLRS